MLYIVYCESANYAGYGQYFVVEAQSKAEAGFLVEPVAEDYFREQDEDQLVEEALDLDGMSYSTIETVEVFNELHYSWKYYQDPGQAEFYIKVNL
jgi:hypothetical protein